jgi:hypothetical protein
MCEVKRRLWQIEHTVVPNTVDDLFREPKGELGLFVIGVVEVLPELTLWRELQLDLFWSELLGVSSEGTRWGNGRLLVRTFISDSLILHLGPVASAGAAPAVQCGRRRAKGGPSLAARRSQDQGSVPYSALSTKSLSAPDSAPQTSPLRPASCRTPA